MLSNIKNSLLKGRNVVPMERRNKVIVYLFILSATSLDNLNVSGTLTSIFSITESFDSTTTTVSWVFASYALTLGAFIIIAGKLADALGPHNVFLIGLFFTSIFALISAVIVKEIIALIVFRALQGIFAASLIPSAFALTGSYFTGVALQRAVTGLILALTAIFGVGLILGGAFSMSSIGYKGLYYFTFAIGMTLFIALYFLIIPIDITEGHKNLRIRDLDFGGSIFLVIGLLLIILGLTEGGESWHRKSSYIPLVIGVLVFFSVVIFEMGYIQNYKDKVDSRLKQIEETKVNVEGSEKKEETKQITTEVKGSNDWRYTIQLLFPREVITIPNFFQYLVSTFLFYIDFIAIMSTMIQYNLYITLDPPILAAVKVLPVPLGLTVGALLYKEKTAQRIGTKFVIMASPILLLTMTVWLSRVDFRKSHNFWKYQCFSELIFGFGINLYFQVYWNDILTGTPVHLQGVVSGILQTAGQIGICFGNTIIAALVGDLTLNHDYDSRVELHERFKKNFYLAFAASGCLCLALVTIKGKKTENKEAADVENSIATNQNSA